MKKPPALPDRRQRHQQARLLIALGTEAAMAGHRVRYTLATNLVNELVEAADEKMLTKTIARYGRVDRLCVDLRRRLIRGSEDQRRRFRR